MFKKTRRRVTLRKELHRLYEQMEAIEDMSSPKYAALVRRAMEINATLNDGLEANAKVGQAIGGILIGGAGLALAYRNDTSEEPTTRKETKGALRDWLRPREVTGGNFLQNLFRRD